MKIFVTGTRGIPHIPGGVETHCENLYPIIAEMGHKIILARRATYIKDKLLSWKGITLVNLPSSKSKRVEAIGHTFLSILNAKKHRCDILHVHAIGPSLLVPFARLLGLRVVVTNHGPDYDRQKWSGFIAKKTLRLGEYFGCKFANEVIVISVIIQKIVANRCKRSSHLIHNGVTQPPDNIQTDYLTSLNIKPNNYILAAARFVPEKGLHDLITAFKNTSLNCQLVLAGDADHQDEYSTMIKNMAADDERIVLTGFITGEKLQQTFQHAKLFVLPSYHEGLPIALLEALGFNLTVLISDIPANLEVNLRKHCYFKCGNIEDLGLRLLEQFNNPPTNSEQKEIKQLLDKEYNWHNIARQTIEVYKKAILD